MKNHRIRVISMIGITSMCLITSQSVFAGSINDNESRVIGVAQGTFEYNGEQYIAKQSYVNQLVGQLSKDGVDLTSEQADAAINKIYSGVEGAIASGYIVKVSSDNADQDNDEKDNTVQDIPKDNTEDKTNTKEEQNPVTADKGTSQKNNDGTVSAIDAKGNTVAQFKGALKDTGFSLKPTIITLILTGLVLIASIIASLKYITFARKHVNRT